MKVTLEWLNEYVKIDDLTPAFIADKLLGIGFEVESLTYLGEGIENVVTAKVVSMHTHPVSHRLNVCEVNVGDKTQQIITAATNVRANDIVCAALVGATLPNGKQILAADFKGVPSYGMLCGAAELGVDRDNLDYYFAADDDGTNRNDKDGLLILDTNTPLGVDVKKVLGLDDYLLDIAITANRGDCHSVYGIARELAASLKRKLKPLDLSYKTYSESKNFSVSKNSIQTDFTNNASTNIVKENLNIGSKNNTKNDLSSDLNNSLVKALSGSVTNTDIKVYIKDKNLCTRYIGSFIKHVKIAPSPLWIRRRLKACGRSCRNNIVDITNYVLLEVGQPLHAFDQSVIEGDITIRRANANEEMILLDDTIVKLTEDMLVIADDKKSLALAGIMGGKDSGIYDTTTTVFLESARFARGNIRATARALGLKSDSSQRFEKGLDFDSPEIGRRRALSLISKLGAGKIIDNTVSDGATKPKNKLIHTTYAKFKEILGIEIPKPFIKDILKRLQFVVSDGDADSNGKKRNNVLEVTVPTFREDVDNFTDLIEEAIRFYGYDKLTESNLTCKGSAEAGISTRRQNINKIEALCCGIGGYEINNYSFIPAKHLDMLNLNENDNLRQAIRIINPLSEEYAYMRTQLVSGMLETLRRNQSRQNDEIILFEIDNAFVPHSLPLNELPDENLTLCVGFLDKNTDFYSVKAFVRLLCDAFKLKYRFAESEQKYLHPGKSAKVVINDECAGDFGMIHPLVAEAFGLTGDIYVIHLNLTGFIDNPQKIVKYQPLPKYPFVERDLSLTLRAEVAAGKVIDLIKSADTLVRDVRIFDVYCGSQIEKGYKSLTLKVLLQNYEKTMTESEINQVINKIISLLTADGIHLRQF